MGATLNTTRETVSLDRQGTSRWSRLAAVGLLMEGAASILMLAAAALWGLSVGEDLVFFVLPGIAGVGGAWLVLRQRALWKVVAIVLGVLIAAMLFWTAFGLVEPDSIFDFVPGVLVVGGLLVTLIAGIASIRSGRHGAATRPEGGERRAIQVVLAGVAVLTVLSIGLTLAGRESVSDDLAAEADLVVDLKDFEFGEDAYATSGGGTILVKNSDPFLHTFTIDALDIDVDLTPGSEKLITLPESPGTYVLYCEPHTSDPDDPSDDDMAAELTVD